MERQSCTGGDEVLIPKLVFTRRNMEPLVLVLKPEEKAVTILSLLSAWRRAHESFRGQICFNSCA